MKWIAALLLLALPAAARAAEPSTRPYTLETEIRSHPPLRLYRVVVDLSDPRVHLKVVRADHAKVRPPWETALTPVSELARKAGLSIAVNGNLFQSRDAPVVLGRKDPYLPGTWARCCGWAMSDGVAFSDNPINRDWPVLAVLDSGRVLIGQMLRLPDNARQAVAGFAQVVTDGDNTGPQGSLAPRTGAGIDRSGHKLILLVVDGRRPDFSVGVTPRQLGDEMLRAGAWQAINLDGGGSSTLVINDGHGPGVVNTPSDGHDLPIPLSIERPVADALGVVIDSATRP